ncbi:hypothetical protein MLD52_10820 [Puniceicoccaceae bacterium K14]|nr:hypothetical protein [Puniceicoccaceae bacterium K14]
MKKILTLLCLSLIAVGAFAGPDIDFPVLVKRVTHLGHDVGGKTYTIEYGTLNSNGSFTTSFKDLGTTSNVGPVPGTSYFGVPVVSTGIWNNVIAANPSIANIFSVFDAGNNYKVIFGISEIPRLFNVSTRGDVTNSPIIGGIVVVGDEPLKVLLRGVGPGLSQFGVAGSSNPTMAVYSGSTNLVTNTKWGTGSYSSSSEIIAASASSGAFSLSNGSNDCAVVMTLQPGAYTVIISGPPGEVIFEAYEVN